MKYKAHDRNATHPVAATRPDMRTGGSHANARRGFTLIEASMLIAGLGLAASLLLPTLGALRTDARLAGSRDNLRELGEAHFAYSEENSGFIAGYDWQSVRVPGDNGFDVFLERDLGGGAIRAPRTNLEAAQAQLNAILRKSTGRFDGADQIRINETRVPHRRFGQLPLLDWLGGSVTDAISVSPLDLHLQEFQSNPLDSEALPGGGPPSTSYGNWSSTVTVVQWPFASSYLTTTYAWSSSRPDLDGEFSISPEDSGTFMVVRDVDRFSLQLHASVRFPSNKALLFEEFDYSQGLGNQGRYYADPLASVNVLAFDGSAPRIATADANPGWDPQDFTNMDSNAELRYHSIDTRYFSDDSLRPEPYGGYYKWTRGGLEGIDFGAGEISTIDW